MPRRVVPKSGIVVPLWLNAKAGRAPNFHGRYEAATVAEVAAMNFLLVQLMCPSIYFS
jgi:hypothetical protein